MLGLLRHGTINPIIGEGKVKELRRVLNDIRRKRMVLVN